MNSIVEGNLARSDDLRYAGDKTALQWLLEARDGDPEALLRLDYYVETLAEKCAARHGVPAGEVEKLADVVVSRLPKAVRRFDPARGNVRNWVLGITRKVVADYFRRSPKMLSMDDHSEEWVDEENESPNQTYERRRSAAELRRAVAELSPRRRRILIMHRYWGRSHKEIAQRLGIQSGTCRVELCLALRDLADRLGFPKPIR